MITKPYFRKTERVAVIESPDMGGFVYVFATISQGDGSDTLKAGMNGRGSTVIKVHASADRRSEFRYANATRVIRFDVKTEDIPEDISLLITELLDLYEEEDFDKERADELNRKINNYFTTE